ncbi:hypothetical protein O7599_04835 [Streptomyces sp. WMMC500]|uniref:hypothetical protein n=1 Tax=Streptomyces sp. WMMC500 TaxID=3015154 RepID=UPI00248C1023|nr:hypothetical protein [Streptomyces sp. WMMC500]WBB61880.1 hypothetical protein O7599_04835 [Streptomyces sp. WMMC500]
MTTSNHRTEAPQDWFVPRRQAHPALGSEADSAAVQGMRVTAAAPPYPGHRASGP